MGRRLRPFIVALAVSAAIVGFVRFERSLPIAITRDEVVEVRLQPVPEGPVLYVTRHPESPNAPSLDQIEGAIPVPPGRVWQGWNCHLGGDVVIVLADGREVRYGPCRWPEGIRRLREAALAASKQPHAA